MTTTFDPKPIQGEIASLESQIIKVNALRTLIGNYGVTYATNNVKLADFGITSAALKDSPDQDAYKTRHGDLNDELQAVTDDLNKNDKVIGGFESLNAATKVAFVNSLAGSQVHDLVIALNQNNFRYLLAALVDGKTGDAAKDAKVAFFNKVAPNYEAMCAILAKAGQDDRKIAAKILTDQTDLQTNRADKNALYLKIAIASAIVALIAGFILGKTNAFGLLNSTAKKAFPVIAKKK